MDGTLALDMVRARAAAMTSTASAPTSPDDVWVGRPTGEMFARFYPRRALSESVSGRVVLRCTIKAEGYVDCAVKSEEPHGWDFGPAAVSISRALQANLNSKEKIRVGSVRDVPITFKMDTPQPTPDIARITEDAVDALKPGPGADFAARAHYLFALETLGCELTDQRDKLGAVAAYREALDLARAMAAEYPERADLQRFVWGAMEHLANTEGGGVTLDDLVQSIEAAKAKGPIAKVDEASLALAHRYMAMDVQLGARPQ